MSADRTKAARELLAFYSEAGVDALIGEAPVDRFADPGPALSSPPPERGRPGGGDALSARTLPGASPHLASAGASASKPAAALAKAGDPPPAGKGVPAPLAPDAAIMAARAAARTAQSLEDLRAILERFDGCPLKLTAKKLVFADGAPLAKVMFVGEAPGREEDLEGLPFVGRSGQLLDRMMAAIGLDRTSAYIANIIPWRPPGNRTPTPQEAAICLPFILRQIELCDPDILVCLGQPASQALLGVKDGIIKTRGRWLAYHTGRREIRAIATFHPAYLLRSPLQKRLAWRDFLAVKKALAG